MEESKETTQSNKLFEQSKRNLRAVDSEKNFHFILNTYILIGINFPNQVSSTLKAHFRTFMAIFFHLFSTYFFLIIMYDLLIKGVTNGEALTAFLQFLITNLIRLHFIFRAENIVAILNNLAKVTPLDFTQEQQKSFKARIILYVLLIIIMIAGISNEAIYPKNYKETEKEVYQFFGLPRPNTYFLILEGIIETTRNFYEISTVGLTFILLCLIYMELECFVAITKIKISTLLSNPNIDSKVILDCSDVLCKASKIVSSVDKEFSPFLFYIILLYILQIMAFICIFAIRYPGLIQSIAFVVLTCHAIVCICIICLLASRVPEGYGEIKEIIMSSENVRKEIALGDSVAVSIIGLRQILKEINRNFHLTAIRAVQIDKMAIITILCSIITYGVILFQMFQVTNEEFLKLCNSSIIK